MNDKKKTLSDSSLDNISEEHISGMADSLCEKAIGDTNSDNSITAKGKKRGKFSIFALVVSIAAIIGVVVITGVIISNSGFFYARNFEHTINDDGTVTITRYSADSAEIVIPEEIGGKKVTSIGDGAFFGCEFLTSVTIPGSVTSIGDGAFFGCEFLTSVTIPGSVTSIGIRSFYECESLTSITIPDSVTYINETAFGRCKSLTFINVDSNNKNYCAIDGVLLSKDKTELIYYPAGKTDTSYTIPNSVTSIGGFSFLNCTSLASVTIPNSVTSIGNFAFFECEAFTSVIIPDSVTSIGDYAFGYCTFLTSVTIPDSVINIGEGVFDGCDALTSVPTYIQ